jgi:hypothetical protein
LGLRSKPLVALSIVLVLAGALGGWHPTDDVDEYVPAALSERTSHQALLTTPTHSIAPEHCALCHWLQAMGKAAPVAKQLLANQSFQFVQAASFVERIRTTSQLALPARAPPLS